MVELIERDYIRETMSLRWTVNGECALRVMPLGGSPLNMYSLYPVWVIYLTCWQAKALKIYLKIGYGQL